MSIVTVVLDVIIPVYNVPEVHQQLAKVVLQILIEI